MTQTRIIGGAIVTFADDTFICPICTKENDAVKPVDLFERLYKSKSGLCKCTCQGCKRKLEYTTDIKGDLVVWEFRKPENFTSKKR